MTNFEFMQAAEKEVAKCWARMLTMTPGSMTLTSGERRNMPRNHRGEYTEELLDRITELETEIKFLAGRVLELKLKAEADYIRGYKEGRRTAGEGGMN